jgi:hypothetical protein
MHSITEQVEIPPGIGFVHDIESLAPILNLTLCHKQTVQPSSATFGVPIASPCTLNATKKNMKGTIAFAIIYTSLES